MILFLNAATHPKPWQLAPQRRRVIVLGAGRTGLSAAYHLGEHSLLLEQRSAVESQIDRCRPDTLHEDGVPDRESIGVPGNERKALFICSSTGQSPTGAATVIRIERWEPPAFAPVNNELRESASPRALFSLLRGEVCFGSQAVRISPTHHRLELADGRRFIYDKLLCTLSLAAVRPMLAHDLPAHVRRDEALRYWLSAHDIEPADRVTQICHGDVDELAAGKRIADIISRALSGRFHRQGSSTSRDRLFEPRVVRPEIAPAVP
jgi:hypothetical protein